MIDNKTLTESIYQKTQINVTIDRIIDKTRMLNQFNLQIDV